MTGSGFGLTNFQITSSAYPCKGNVESSYKVSMARDAVYGACKDNFYRSAKVSASDVSQSPKQGIFSNIVTWTGLLYVFTADQFYEFDFPDYGPTGYANGYEMYENIWLYKGEKMEMWTNGNAVFYETSYNYTVAYTSIVKYPVGDTVEIWAGGPSPAWGYGNGRNIYWGPLNQWNPPASAVTRYDQ